jgi:hypothetical protein
MAKATFLLGAVLVAGCGEEKRAPAAAAAKAEPTVESDRAAVATAETLVRGKLVNPDAAKVPAAAAYDNDGVEIVCGTFDHRDPDGTAATGQRYITVGGEQSFLEPEMGKAEMDKAYAQFCRAV